MSTRRPKTRSPAEFRAWLHAHGITLAAWCEQHGIERQTASDLLRGTTKGLYGKSHQAAVAMNLKPDPAELDERSAA